MVGAARRGVNEWGERSLRLSPRKSMLVKKGGRITSRNWLVFSTEIDLFRWLQGIPVEQRWRDLYSGRPTRCNMSEKRGSECRLSRKGSVFRYTKLPERASTAIPNQ